MLNRRILRIKAFKTIYSLVENPSMTCSEALSQLELSCQATRDLYLFMLAAIPAVTSEALNRIEAAKGKFRPTEEERNPNLKFVNNGIAPAIGNDPDFSKVLSKKHLSWDQYDVFLRHLYESIRSSAYFSEYMRKDASSLKDDSELWVKIFENEFVGNPELSEILEDMNIWWNDDLAYALTACCKSIVSLASGKPWSLPELYLSQMPGNEGKDSDRDFVRKIVSRAVADYQEDARRIDELTPKWDFDRICTTDVALLVAGMSEAAACPEIDSKIITSEYVEISKFYSTPESKSFVNGVLDKLINNSHK